MPLRCCRAFGRDVVHVHLTNGWAELPVTGVFAVHDGQITAWRDYFDLSTLQTGFAEHARVCCAPPPSRKRRTVMTEFTTRWCEATMGRIPCARPEVPCTDVHPRAARRWPYLGPGRWAGGRAGVHGRAAGPAVGCGATHTVSLRCCHDVGCGESTMPTPLP